MTDAIYVFSVLLSVIVLLSLKTNSLILYDGIDSFPVRLLNSISSPSSASFLRDAATNQKGVEVQPSPFADNSTRDMFSVIIVTFNEVLLEKTVHNVLENTDPGYIYEILIIDDCSDVPVTWDAAETRVRIIRNDHRMGLIGARYVGGNNARGEYLAFIDAHVFVGPKWLKTPKRLLMEDPKTIVNYINFNLDADNYLPKKAWQGIGSCATITMDLHQIWGGGSRQDMFSPITMGMFVISKYWWNQGAMDPDLRTWGGENVEISLRTWLCGGRIVVAKDSFVAHGFRTRFPYSVNGKDVQRNYIRIANVWLDEKYLAEFYKASRTRLVDGRPATDFGDISERLRLKEQLHCKPFSYYAEKFKGRALCLPKWMQPKDQPYSCGGLMTVTPNDISYLTHEQMFFRNATR